MKDKGCKDSKASKAKTSKKDREEGKKKIFSFGEKKK
jgi:hypothetical protein